MSKGKGECGWIGGSKRKGGMREGKEGLKKKKKKKVPKGETRERRQRKYDEDKNIR